MTSRFLQDFLQCTSAIGPKLLMLRKHLFSIFTICNKFRYVTLRYVTLRYVQLAGTGFGHLQVIHFLSKKLSQKHKIIPEIQSN